MAITDLSPGFDWDSWNHRILSPNGYAISGASQDAIVLLDQLGKLLAHVAGVVLCFGFRMRKMLLPYWCLSSY